MQPYPYQPPPPPRSSNTGVIVAIVAVVVVVGVFGLFALFGVVTYMRASRAAALATPTAMTAVPAMTAAPIPTATSALTESYRTPNGLVTAHYPSDWAAKAVDDVTLTLSRNLSDGSGELVYVAAIQNPITNDVDELARVLMSTQTKTIEATGEKWVETSRAHTACFQSFPGLAVQGTFRADGTQEKLRMCFWLRGHKAYVTKLMVPEIHEATDLALLQSMIDATDFK